MLSLPFQVIPALGFAPNAKLFRPLFCPLIKPFLFNGGSWRQAISIVSMSFAKVPPAV